MTGFSLFLHNLSPYLPYIILGVVLLAIAILIYVAFTTSKALRNSGGTLEPEGTEAKTSSYKKHIHRYPMIGGRFSEWLSRRGFFKVSDLSMSFLKALELMRERIGTSNYKYHLPWFLLIGPTGSGKTSLMEHSEQVLPLGRPHFGTRSFNPQCRWWFLNRGIILDLKGTLCLSQEGTDEDENGWRTALTLLSRYRPRRPADGIILTIPATELYGIEKLHGDDIIERARFMAQKLLAAQSLLGIQLPVYVVVTKTDIIPGFKNFCQAIPKDNRHNMIGWSNPYTLNTAYSGAWVEEAFETIHQNLDQLRLEILAENANQDVQNGAFIFPMELMHLKTHLDPYLNYIFRPTSYEEPLLFRGIYFTGDAGEGFTLDTIAGLEQEDLTIETEAGELLQRDEKDADHKYRSEHSDFLKLDIGEIDQNSDERKDRHIFFFNDVLNKKICAETGIAQPIRYRMKIANRNLNWARGTIVAIMLLGTFGMMHAHDRFSQNREYLLPILAKIKSILQELPVYRDNHTHMEISLFEEQSRQLLDMMSHIERSNFFSIFVPSSWFSHIHNKLQTTLKVSYDQIVLRAVYMDLLMRARELLTLRPGPQDVTPTLGMQLQPTMTVEYQLFKNYVEKFISLSMHVDKFNRLKETSDSDLLKELVSYTLNVTLPKEFIDNYRHFYKVLQKVPFPKIDLHPYQENAQETLRILYFHFLNNLFSPANQNSIIGKLRTILYTFGSKQSHGMPSTPELRKISQGLNEFIPFLGQPGNNWIDANYFDPGKNFDELMNEVSQFSLFGPKVVEKFAVETATAFRLFHNELRDLNTMLIERPHLQMGQVYFYSEGLFALHKGLSILFQEPFMAQPSGETINTVVPETHVVFWNAQLIDLANSLAMEFDDFMSNKINSLPHGIRDTLAQVAHLNLEKNIISLIARAQTYMPIRSDHSKDMIAEEVLREKIADTKTISPKFLKLLEILSRGNMGTTYVELRTLLGTLSTRLLDNVQTLLDSYKLYSIKENNFKWWSGTNSPIMEAFGARDEHDLQAYLDQQRYIIRHIALDFAAPMVSFLTSPLMQEFQGNLTLVTFWKRIIEQISGYEKKRPDNSVTVLEEFILRKTGDITLKRCFSTLGKSDEKGSSGDFFIDRRNMIRRDLLGQCEILARKKNLENYEKMSELFNETLKGKFPFYSGPVTESTPEADPEDIRAFFELFDEFGGDPKVILNQVYQLGSRTAAAFSFLKNMNKVRKFFGGFLDASDKSTTPSFDFSVEFRTNRDREVNANVIIDWVFSPDDSTKISNHDKKRFGRWNYGDTATLSLRWPQSSDVKPFRDSTQTLMTVDDDSHTATFSFPGKWSLLWLIFKQGANGSSFANMKDSEPYTLRFEIPTGPEEKSIVFNRITLLAPGKGKSPGKPISIPTFPSKAPILTNEMIPNVNKPVISTGQVIYVEKEEEDDEKNGANGKKDVKNDKSDEDQEDQEAEESTDDDSSDEDSSDDSSDDDSSDDSSDDDD